MTEQEAREQLEALLEYGLSLDKEIAVEVGIKALKEVRQLRKEMWELNQICRDYTSLGTVEELKEAKEKQIAKQPTNKQGNPLWGYCPSCKKPISKGDSPIGCKWCLQRVDWRNEDAE